MYCEIEAIKMSSLLTNFGGADSPSGGRRQVEHGCNENRHEPEERQSTVLGLTRGLICFRPRALSDCRLLAALFTILIFTSHIYIRRSDQFEIKVEEIYSRSNENVTYLRVGK